MPVRYRAGGQGRLPYWYADDPTIREMERMVFLLGKTRFYNFVVVGDPCEISPEWNAKHPNQDRYEYDYAVSYSIPARTIGHMLDNSNDVVDAFNYYLGSDEDEHAKCWREIYTIKLMDRRK